MSVLSFPCMFTWALSASDVQILTLEELVVNVNGMATMAIRS